MEQFVIGMYNPAYVSCELLFLYSRAIEFLLKPFIQNNNLNKQYFNLQLLIRLIRISIVVEGVVNDSTQLKAYQRFSHFHDKLKKSCWMWIQTFAT